MYASHFSGFPYFYRVAAADNDSDALLVISFIKFLHLQ